MATKVRDYEAKVVNLKGQGETKRVQWAETTVEQSKASEKPEEKEKVVADLNGTVGRL